jgi:hypothetical protein
MILSPILGTGLFLFHVWLQYRDGAVPVLCLVPGHQNLGQLI